MQVSEANAMVHDVDGWFGMRHKISVVKQFTVHICLLLVPSNSGSKYCVIVAQMNRKKHYRQVLNASAIHEHFEDHIDVDTYDVEDYNDALQSYYKYVKMANDLFACRTHFWN